jgi:hypothetical protein
MPKPRLGPISCLFFSSFPLSGDSGSQLVVSVHGRTAMYTTASDDSEGQPFFTDPESLLFESRSICRHDHDHERKVSASVRCRE